MAKKPHPLVAGNWKMNGLKASLAQIEAMAQGNLLAELHFEQFFACQTSHYSDAVPPMVVAGRRIVCRASRAARARTISKRRWSP